MQNILKNLFNDCDKTGDLILNCKDSINIKCHSFLLQLQSEYFKGLFNFHKDTKNCNVQYESKLVKLVLNKLYDPSYKFGKLELNEIFQINKMIDELLIVEPEDIRKELVTSFKLLLNKENWFDILKEVYGLENYKFLEDLVLDYFKQTVLSGNKLQNLFDDIELDTDLGRKLLSIVLNKLENYSGWNNGSISIIGGGYDNNYGNVLIGK